MTTAERASGYFISATIDFIDFLDVPATALHATLSEDYGRPFLQIGQWSRWFHSKKA